ncbi:MAG: hypothetical protein EOM24_12300, partial [Chloroflexia bacterium]|nr:hypothetical protein [Chloroflexia bacterium]
MKANAVKRGFIALMVIALLFTILPGQNATSATNPSSSSNTTLAQDEGSVDAVMQGGENRSLSTTATVTPTATLTQPVPQAGTNRVYLPLVRGQGETKINLDLTSLPQEMQESIRQAVESRPSTLLPGTKLAIVSLRIADNAALATLAKIDNITDAVGMGSNGVLIIFYKHPDLGWQSALEGTVNFNHLLRLVPETLLSSEAKFMLDANQPSSQLAAADIRFPWDSSQSWMLTYGWHEN